MKLNFDVIIRKSVFAFDIDRFIDYICIVDVVQDNDCQAMSGFWV